MQHVEPLASLGHGIDLEEANLDQSGPGGLLASHVADLAVEAERLPGGYKLHIMYDLPLTSL